MSVDEHPVATLWRRLAAMVYDALLLLALWMVTTALFLPITGGEPLMEAGPVMLGCYRLSLVAVWVAFYGLFWTRRGQTLGMSTWRIRLVRDDGQPVRWIDAVCRLFAGLLSALPLGLGFLWTVVDRDHLAWHDRLSGTRPVVLPKKRAVG